MLYLTETKICPPLQHRLGIIDGDRQVIKCLGCGIKLASTARVILA